MAANEISQDLSVTPVQMGIIFSVFAWTYSIVQFPSGMIVCLVKVRVLYPVTLVAWSLATIVQGGDFLPALALIGALALLGLCTYVFLVGKIEENPCSVQPKILTSKVPRLRLEPPHENNDESIYEFPDKTTFCCDCCGILGQWLR